MISLLSTSPTLAERQALLTDLAPDRSREELHTSAVLITQIASALMLTSALPSLDGSPTPTVHDLAWIWPRLL